ncbi:MAG: GNAT family N-acetyltransferase [Bacillota bacterium]
MQVEDIHGILPILETPRLILGRITQEDALHQFERTSDEEMTRFLTWGPHRTLEEAQAALRYVLGQYETMQVAPWGIVLKETERSIGACGYRWWFPNHGRAEVSYMFHRGYWARG